MYPPIPKSFAAPGGSVRVHLLKRPTVEGEAVSGSWDRDNRLIEVSSALSLREQWHTLYHELMHVALTDSGARHFFKNREQELLCEAVATARMRERFG